MSRLKGLLRQLRTLFRKEAVDWEQREEIAFHIEMQTQELIRQGMSAEEARRAAHVAFGGVERYREARRQASWVRVLEETVADVRYVLRSLRRRPGFTAAVALTLGLGVGGTTAIFSVVDGLFLQAPAGVRQAEALRRIYIQRDEGSIRSGVGGAAGSFVDYAALRDGLRGATSVASFLGPRLVDLGSGVDAEQVRIGVVSQSYFGTLGVRTAAGRFFLPEEDTPGGAGTGVVVSHGFAERRLGGADGALGETLMVNRQTLTVLGVAEEGFTGLDATPVDLWVPNHSAPLLGLLTPRSFETAAVMGLVHLVVRLPDGTDVAALESEATTVLTHAAEEYAMLDPTPMALSSSLVPAAGPHRSSAADLSLWLGIVAVLVLVIACANVANLLLARGMTRRREMAVRASLGATRGRVARQHLVESTALALLGGVTGIFITYWGLALVRQFPLPPSAGQLDARLLLFAMAVAVATGLLFGIAPAVRAGRVQTVPSLRESGATVGVVSARTRRMLVALQVALSLVLLVGAGLFVRSLRQVHAIDPGLDLRRLVTVQVDLQRAGYSPEEREVFYDEARRRLTGLPQVESSALVHFAPFGGWAYGIPWEFPGVESPGFREGPYRNLAGPGYFATLGTQVLSGREFTTADAKGDPTAIVNERMARALAPDGRAVNVCVALEEQVESGGCTRIVGVVENYRHRYLEEADVPMIFLPRERDPTAITAGGPSLVVRTRGDAAEVAGELRSLLQGLRPDLPYVSVQTLEEAVRGNVLPFRLGAMLFTLFGVLALVLSAIGLYGVLSYFVSERTPEIGVRRALGAPAARVIRLVVRQGVMPVAAGVAVGLATAWAGTRFISTLLFGVDARDPVAFLGAAAFLLAVATIATLLPGRRAARVDPMVALRED